MRSCEEDETFGEQPRTHGLALANRKRKLGFDNGLVCAHLCGTRWHPICIIQMYSFDYISALTGRPLSRGHSNEGW